jgi:hypothetical protein
MMTNHQLVSLRVPQTSVIPSAVEESLHSGKKLSK